MPTPRKILIKDKYCGYCGAHNPKQYTDFILNFKRDKTKLFRDKEIYIVFCYECLENLLLNARVGKRLQRFEKPS